MSDSNNGSVPPVPPSGEPVTPPPTAPESSAPGGYSSPASSAPGGYSAPAPSAPGSSAPGGYSAPASSAPGGYAAPAGYATSAPASTPKTLSLISMIGGIAGAFLSLFGGWGLLFSIAAVVLGHLGQKREGAPAKGFWLTGLITGYVGILIALAYIVFYVVLFLFVGAAAGGMGEYNY